MSKPSVTFPHPQQVALGILRAAVVTDPVWTGVKFGTILPEERKEDRQGLPYVMIAVDGSAGRYPITSNPTIRVAVWHRSEIKTLDLAQLCRAILASFPGSAELRSTGNSTDPIPAPDPDSGSPMASFSIDLRLRPIPF